MMGEEEASVAVVNSGDNRNKNRLKWTSDVTAKKPGAKKLAKQSLKIVKELENSFGWKDLPEEVPHVEKFYEVSNPNLSLEENSSCLQTPMTKFKLKWIGGKWFGEVIARAPCTKKQAKDVTNPNYSTKENASCPYVQNEALDQRSYDALGGEEGMIFKPRPNLSGGIQKQKRSIAGCTMKRPRPYSSGGVQKQKRKNAGCTKKRSNSLHQLLFLDEGLQDGTKLVYCDKGEVKCEGYKQGKDIRCSRCNDKFSPSEFEAHAGFGARRKPYHYIRTTNRCTLHDIALRLSNGGCIQSSSDNKCAVCGVGGELVDCDGCHCAYHAVCLGLEGIPTGDWHCSRCTEKIGPSVRDSSPVISQPDRVVNRAQEFSVDTFDELKIMQCYQCGRQYHVSWLLDNGLGDLKELSKDKWFCHSDCDSIHSTMQGLLLKENKVLLAPVLEKHIGKAVTDGAVNSMHWQILSGTHHITDSRLLLEAAAIFKDSFKPIRSKTCDDLIATAVRGENIFEQKSRQIFCVVLIVDSVVSSAAILRIISREIAELPVVATRRKYRGKGYFRALFSCIEQLLISINVERIVLPALEVIESMWTNKLGFKKISDEQLSEYTKDFQLTLCSETSMLEKVLLQTASQFADSSRT